MGDWHDWALGLAMWAMLTAAAVTLHHLVSLGVTP